MSNRYTTLRPPYPVYDSTPIFGGNLPTIDDTGPVDLRPSAMNPYYDQYLGARGRNMAGLGSMMSADPGISTYASELDTLAAADDVQGNGVFDPHMTHGNLHPDYGVFADHENIPGYLAREQFYQLSPDVKDATTGEPVMFVPGGAVAIDQAQADTIRERQLLWELPPGVSPQPTAQPPAAPGGGDWIPQEWSTPISGLGEDAAVAPPTGKASGGMIAAFAIVGVAVGIFAATIIKR